MARSVAFDNGSNLKVTSVDFDAGDVLAQTGVGTSDQCGVRVRADVFETKPCLYISAASNNIEPCTDPVTGLNAFRVTKV